MLISPCAAALLRTVFLADCRLLLASLPQLPALQELHIFSTGVLDSRSLSLLASLSQAHCKLQEVSLAFSPHKGFVPADLGVLERSVLCDIATSLTLAVLIDIGYFGYTALCPLCVHLVDLPEMQKQEMRDLDGLLVF